MEHFYLISQSFLQELLLSASLKCQKWSLYHLNHQVSTPHCAPKYSVFLNFRGRDTRHNFVHLLSEELRFNGVTAFQDDKSVKKGDPIGRELFRAIDECRIAIVILSKNYAASEWCLEELVKIMKRKKRLTIFPVFYDVRPSEVRNLRGSFARAFAEHEKNYENKPRKVKEWKKALCKAAGISGFDLRNYNGDESKCIEDIVEEVCKKLGATESGKYEGRKTVGKCKQKPKLRTQKRVKSQTRPHWRPKGRMMVARAEETPGRTAAQMGRTAVYPHTTISSMYSCDKKVKSPTPGVFTPQPDSLWGCGMYSFGTKSGWNWMGIGVGLSLTIHTTVLRVVVYMHFVLCQQTRAKGKGKVKVVVRLYLLAFCSMPTRKQLGGWMAALMPFGELRNFAFAFVLLTLILTIIVCQGMATKAKPHLLLKFTILKRVFEYLVPCQQTTSTKAIPHLQIEPAQTAATGGWVLKVHYLCSEYTLFDSMVHTAVWAIRIASLPYYPHQSLQTIEPYVRERKASYSLDVG